MCKVKVSEIGVSQLGRKSRVSLSDPSVASPLTLKFSITSQDFHFGVVQVVSINSIKTIDVGIPGCL